MGQPLALDVLFAPGRSRLPPSRVLVVIDTLRASTVITTLLAGGVRAVYPCTSVAAARALAASFRSGRRRGVRLCGERGGLPPRGFDYGNSAVEFAALDVRGWTVVQATSNGTRALTRAAATTGLPPATAPLVACLRNRAAAAAVALRAARAARAGGIDVLCAGDHGGTTPSVEDTFTAGALVEALLNDATERAEPLTLLEGARLARRLFHGYGRSPLAAFADSPHAADLRRLGFQADLAFAAHLDVESCVPRAGRDREGRVVVRPGSS